MPTIYDKYRNVAITKFDTFITEDFHHEDVRFLIVGHEVCPKTGRNH